MFVFVCVQYMTVSVSTDTLPRRFWRHCGFTPIAEFVCGASKAAVLESERMGKPYWMGKDDPCISVAFNAVSMSAPGGKNCVLLTLTPSLCEHDLLWKPATLHCKGVGSLLAAMQSLHQTLMRLC